MNVSWWLLVSFLVNIKCANAIREIVYLFEEVGFGEGTLRRRRSGVEGEFQADVAACIKEQKWVWRYLWRRAIRLDTHLLLTVSDSQRT